MGLTTNTTLARLAINSGLVPRNMKGRKVGIFRPMRSPTLKTIKPSGINSDGDKIDPFGGFALLLRIELVMDGNTERVTTKTQNTPNPKERTFRSIDLKETCLAVSLFVA